ncbi:MAG: peptidase M3 [Deltaproteobacteria bacterium]|nr:peptidase M3 [Deltaproteobacteria bacterium]
MDSIDRAIVDLNREYAALHTEKEELFWTTKMGITREYAAFNDAENALQAFRQDAARLSRVRALAAEAKTDAQRATLAGWIRFFECGVIEDPAAQREAAETVELESTIAKARGALPLAWTHPETGEPVRASSVALALKVASDPDERVRKAAFHGLESIETFALQSGFLDLVRRRNRFARRLGYADYYDWKVSTTEGFDKKTLFALLDDLEARTREAGRRRVEAVRAAHGDGALAAWNFRFHTQGDVLRELDPYFRFDDALSRWGRSFTALGIRFEGALLQLDLIVRDGKYENGFCHAPEVPYEDATGRVRARVNFTSTAVPGQVGSGKRAAETLFHEGGHAAHFANMLMGAPCFSQEFAPTSAAFAETQSMFCDSLLADADWMARYALDRDGRPAPWEVVEKATRLTQDNEVVHLRNLLTVCYAEKAIYEIPEAELSADRIMAEIHRVERALNFIDRCPRPTLAVPHLLAGESSCIYHGYVLALGGVAQTRAFFEQRDGYLTDNPNIGPTLREKYWRPGNSITFTDYLARLTGSPFSFDALVADVSRTADEAVVDQRERLARAAERPRPRGPVDLDLTLRMVHGAEVLATTETATFEEVAARYADWVRSLEPKKPA